MESDHFLGCLAKDRCFAGTGVAAFFDGLSVSESPSASFPQGDSRVATQPEVGSLSVDPGPLYPGLGEPSLDLGRSDHQAQVMASSDFWVVRRNTPGTQQPGTGRSGTCPLLWTALDVYRNGSTLDVNEDVGLHTPHLSETVIRPGRCRRSNRPTLFRCRIGRWGTSRRYRWQHRHPIDRSSR